MEDIDIEKVFKFRKENKNYVEGLEFKSFDCYIDEKIFYKIKIFPTKKAMQDYYEEDILGACKNYTVVYSFRDSDKGKFSHFEDSHDNRYESQMGEVLLCEEDLGSRIVTHELTHMVIGYYSERINGGLAIIEDDMENEEIFCYLLGDCISYVYNVLYDYNIIK